MSTLPQAYLQPLALVFDDQAIPLTEPCQKCRGQGVYRWDGGNQTSTCPACSGLGHTINKNGRAIAQLLGFLPTAS